MSAEKKVISSDPSMAELKAAIELIVSQFRDSLEDTRAVVSSLQDEIEDAVEYARPYLSMESPHYRKVWFNLHVCPDAFMAQLTFCFCVS